jgi:hypothetical protein
MNNILNLEATKTTKIIALLELGYTRKQIADLEVLGKYGAIQNVYAKWQVGRSGNTPTRLVFTPSAFNRRFGIEIEAYGCSKDIVARELNAAGIPTHIEGYNHNTRTNWKIVSDGSLTGDNTFELVSPILEGQHGLNQLQTVSEVLVRLRVKINRTCGLHIHFDAAQMNLQTWKNLLLNYATLEPIIDSMMPQSRRGSENTYCKTMRRTDLNNKIRTATTINQVTNLFPNRYQKINTQAYARHRTVEFRQHSGTIEGDKILNWILFLHNLLTYSQQNTIENGTFETLKAFNQDSITNFYHNRIQDLAA